MRRSDSQICRGRNNIMIIVKKQPCIRIERLHFLRLKCRNGSGQRKLKRETNDFRAVNSSGSSSTPRCWRVLYCGTRSLLLLRRRSRYRTSALGQHRQWDFGSPTRQSLAASPGHSRRLLQGITRRSALPGLVNYKEALAYDAQGSRARKAHWGTVARNLPEPEKQETNA